MKAAGKPSNRRWQKLLRQMQQRQRGCRVLREQLPTATSATEAGYPRLHFRKAGSIIVHFRRRADAWFCRVVFGTASSSRIFPAFGALACMLKAERSRRETAQECDAGQKQELVPSRKLSRDMAEELQADCRGGPDARTFVADHSD